MTAHHWLVQWDKQWQQTRKSFNLECSKMCKFSISIRTKGQKLYRYIILLVIWSIHQSILIYYYTPTFYGVCTTWIQTSSLVYYNILKFFYLYFFFLFQMDVSGFTEDDSDGSGQKENSKNLCKKWVYYTLTQTNRPIPTI